MFFVFVLKGFAKKKRSGLFEWRNLGNQRNSSRKRDFASCCGVGEFSQGFTSGFEACVCRKNFFARGSNGETEIEKSTPTFSCNAMDVFGLLGVGKDQGEEHGIQR